MDNSELEEDEVLNILYKAQHSGLFKPLKKVILARNLRTQYFDKNIAHVKALQMSYLFEIK